MPRVISVLLLMIVCCSVVASGQEYRAVVADSVTRMPLVGASVFDRRGRGIGMTGRNGRLPYLSADDCPATIRFIGYKERRVTDTGVDTILMQESGLDLPEVVVETSQRRLLHMIAYVREYSTLSTFTDTVFLFREKMVDFMLPADPDVRFKGWRSPRVLTSASYYRFSNADGLDSVSNRCNYHFTWSDWVGVVPETPLPAALQGIETGSETRMGKYIPYEMWSRSGDRITVDVNVMADTAGRRWVSGFSNFFSNNVGFEQMRVRFDYRNVIGTTISPADLSGYSFNVESNGRGRGMFMFNRVNESFYVNTYAEVYVVDREYVTVKEAKQWASKKFNPEEIEISEPPEAPELQPDIRRLMSRVSNVDHDSLRLSMPPDWRFARGDVPPRKFGQEVLTRLKGIFGIDKMIGDKKRKKRWREFRRESIDRNHSD